MVGYRPVVGKSVGDPVGIGPEITANAVSLSELYKLNSNGFWEMKYH
jgi:4-hydroxy-L-threonine phosphate dehydrogenase PdxA